MVNGEGRNGHCRSCCTYDKIEPNVFLKEKNKVLTPGNLAEMSNLEVICSRNRYMQAGIANYNFLQRVPNQILENCLQPLEVSENCCIHYQRAET